MVYIGNMQVVFVTIDFTQFALESEYKEIELMLMYHT